MSTHLSPFLRDSLTYLTLAGPALLIISGVILRLATTVTSFYYGEKSVAHKAYMAAVTRNSSVIIGLFFSALAYIGVAAAPGSVFQFGAYNHILQANFGSILAFGALTAGIISGARRRTLAQTRLLAILAATFIMGAAAYTTGHSPREVVDAAMAASLCALAVVALTALGHKHLHAFLTMFEVEVRGAGTVVRRPVAAREYRHVRSELEVRQSEAQAMLTGLVRSLRLSPRSRLGRDVLPRAREEVDACFVGELERLDAGRPVATWFDLTTILRNVDPWLYGRWCTACEHHQPLHATSCSTCSGQLNPPGEPDAVPDAGPDESRMERRALGLKCLDLTEQSAAAAAIAGILLILGGLLPAVGRASGAASATSAVLGTTNTYWYSGLGADALLWAWTLVRRPWMASRLGMDAALTVVLAAALAFIGWDLAVSLASHQSDTRTTDIATALLSAGTVNLVVAACLEVRTRRSWRSAEMLGRRFVPRARDRTSALDKPHELHAVITLFRDRHQQLREAARRRTARSQASTPSADNAVQ
jgi:hypothetical protein